MNLLTGKVDHVLASSNIDLVNGHIYKTIGGQILWDVTDDCVAGHNFLGLLSSAYDSKDLDYADYIIEPSVALKKSDLTKLFLAVELGLMNPTVTVANADATDKAIANKLIHNDFAKKIYVVSDEWTWDWYEHDSNIELTALAALDDNTTYTADLVYEVATGKVVIYIDENDIVVTTKPVVGAEGEKVVAEWTYDKDERTVEADLVVDFNGTYTKVGDEITAAKLSDVTVKFANVINKEHGDIAANGYLFGIGDAHGFSFFEAENSKVEYRTLWQDTVKEITADKYTFKSYDCDECNMINEVVIDLSSVAEIKVDDAPIEFVINIDGSTIDFDGNEITITVYIDLTEDGLVYYFNGSNVLKVENEHGDVSTLVDDEDEVEVNKIKLNMVPVEVFDIIHGLSKSSSEIIADAADIILG